MCVYVCVCVCVCVGGGGVTGDNNHMSSTRLRLFYALELRTKMF